MFREVNGYTLNRVEKLKGEFAFSANNKQIKVLSSLFDKQLALLDEEAIYARDRYAELVSADKANGIKPNPTKRKKEALAQAKDYIIATYSLDEYSTAHDEVSRVIVGEPKDVTPKPLDNEKVKEIDDEFKASMDDLVDEFDNSDSVEVKLSSQCSFDGEVHTESNVFDSPNTGLATESSDVSDPSIFDVDIPIEDLFVDLFE